MTSRSPLSPLSPLSPRSGGQAEEQVQGGRTVGGAPGKAVAPHEMHDPRDSRQAASQEDSIAESDFAELLTEHARWYLLLAGTLCKDENEAWGRRHYFQLITECDTVEAYLDDHGARYNRTFGLLTEWVASARGFALAGLRVAHLVHRVEGYFTHCELTSEQRAEVRKSIARSRIFIQRTCVALLRASLVEAEARGVRIPQEGYPSDRYDSDPVLRKLPRNVDQEQLADDQQKIAEVTSKFVKSAELFENLGVRPMQDPVARARWLSTFCNEESARVLEATVHNIQSAYDTYIKNSRLEANDERLLKLRGHTSAALHLLEAVTCLVHFVERHEGARGVHNASQLARVVDRHEVQEFTLNHLLHWASRFMLSALPIAEDLLPTYTDVQSMEVSVREGLMLHARPASLIVAIVHRYGTPVRMQIESETCNAGSMLEMMVAIGSNPEARTLHFHGDVNPLRDIRRLFDCGLGEGGLDQLPEELDYLRQN